MSEALNTNSVDSVVFSRNDADQLVITINAALHQDVLLEKYYQFMLPSAPRPAEIVWNEQDGVLDIGTSKLIMQEVSYPGFDIIADAINEPLVGDALDSALFDEERLEPDTIKDQDQPSIAEGVNNEQPINEESNLAQQDTNKQAAANKAPAVTQIPNRQNVTKIKSNSGGTKIGVAAPSPLADTRVIERLVKEGIGARAKPQRQQKQRREVVPLPVVNHTERGRQLLATAMDGFRENGTDGVDFINTSGIASTKLGQLLDINSHVPFPMAEAGVFASVGAFWYYIASEAPDESVRNLYGAGCRNARNRLTSRKVEGFNRLIAEATWAKVSSNQELRNYMVSNDLKYNCFFLQQGTDLPIRSNLEEWYMPILEEIGFTLKQIKKTGDETRTPDFSFLDHGYARNQNQNQRRRY